MEKYLIRKSFIIILTIFLIVLAFSPIITSYSIEKVFLEKNNGSCVQQGKELKLKHLMCLLRGYVYSPDFILKKVIRNIIFEILKDGNATSDEIQAIVDSSNLNYEKIYISVDVQTTRESDGGALCIPGFLRTWIGHFNAKGSYVMYGPVEYPHEGWHLEIDGEEVSEKDGYIIGFFGIVDNAYTEMPPESFITFMLDGSGILVFHGVSEN